MALRPQATDVSANIKFVTHYGHQYTGSFITPKYPARYGRYTTPEDESPYNIFFGGLPSYTYTTITLHSSHNHLSGTVIRMSLGRGRTTSQVLGFSTELLTPISIDTGYNNSVHLYDSPIDPQTDTTPPAFMFSFAGKHFIAVALYVGKHFKAVA